jgi:hypothetical protein
LLTVHYTTAASFCQGLAQKNSDQTEKAD